MAISGPRLFVYVYAFRSGRRYTLLFAHKLRFWFNLEQKKEKKFGNKSKCTALLIESFSLYLSRYVVVLFFSSLQRERLMKNKLEMKWFSMALDNTKANCKRSMSMREKCWISLGWPSERSHALIWSLARWNGNGPSIMICFSTQYWWQISCHLIYLRMPPLWIKINKSAIRNGFVLSAWFVPNLGWFANVYGAASGDGAKWSCAKVNHKRWSKKKFHCVMISGFH